jgi:hypothetical protein
MAIGNITKAIAECAVKIGYIQRAGENKAQGFKFVGDEHIMAKAQSALAECELSISPREIVDVSRARVELQGRNGARFENQVTIRVTWCVSHSSGEVLECQTIGSGFDGGDKADYKAMTGARKYLFRLLFHIPTGDDPDNSTPESDTDAHAGKNVRASAPDEFGDTTARRRVFEFTVAKVGAGIAGQGTTFHTLCRTKGVDAVRAFGNSFRAGLEAGEQAQDVFLRCVAELSESA